MSPAQPVRISELAALSEVPAATIKHYVREGLVQPVRTGRNVAWFDRTSVERVRRIKALQRERFLPLKVIREVLDEQGTAEETVAASVARALSQRSIPDRRSREQLIAAGLDPRQLDWLCGVGVVGAAPDGTFVGDDLELLRVLGAARRAGIDASMLPVTILAEYLEAVRRLVRIELALFREGVVPNAGGDLSTVTEAATELSERLVVLLRRKLLLPILAETEARPAVGKPEPTAPSAPGPTRKKKRR